MLTFENPFQLEMVIQGNSRWSKEMIWGDLRPSLKPVARHSHTVNNNDDQFCHINYNWTGERVTARGTDDWVWTVRNTVNNNDDQFYHINYNWTGGRASNRGTDDWFQTVRHHNKKNKGDNYWISKVNFRELLI